MTSIGAMVWGVRDIPRAVAFWSAALGYEPREEPTPDWAALVPAGGREGVQLSLKLAESRGPRRHHIDLYSDDQPGDVTRLLALGATTVDDWDYEDDADYVVLADPDGNTFCVVQR